MSVSFLDLLNLKKSLGLDADYLHHVTIINLIFKNESMLRVGKGRGELGEIDLPVVKDRMGQPYIPGSSLKGAFRSFLESILRPKGACHVFSEEYECCSLRADLAYYILTEYRRFLWKGSPPSGSELAKELEGLRIAEKLKQRYAKCGNAESLVGDIVSKLKDITEPLSLDALKSFIEPPCVVCRLFGNKALASHIYISDAKPEEEGLIPSTRTRVAIDRFTGGVAAGPFDYEFVEPGHRWISQMRLINVTLDGTSDVSQALRSLLTALTRFGLYVGGMKSVGHGLIRLRAHESIAISYRNVCGSLEKEYERPLSRFLGGQG